MDEIGVFHDRHLVDERLVEDIFVGLLRCRDLLVLVGEHLHAMLLDRLVEWWHDLRVQGLVKDHLARSAVSDASAVEGEYKSPVGLQVQLLGKCRDAIGGASRSEHDTHTLLFSFQQCVACAGRHLLLTICQCAVEIEHDHLVIHVCINMCCGEICCSVRSILSFRKVTLFC